MRPQRRRPVHNAQLRGADRSLPHILHREVALQLIAGLKCRLPRWYIPWTPRPVVPLQDQRLVKRRDDLEVEAAEAFDYGEARRLDPPLDHSALAIDQLKLGEPQQVADVIDALGSALPGDLRVLLQERL